MKVHNIFIAICIISASLSACNSKQQEQAIAPAIVETEIAGQIQHFGNKTYVGVVEEESSTAVSFTGSGMITKMYVSEGQRVQKGQPIAEIDHTQANNMIRAAQAQVKQATDAVQRMKQLHDNNALPDIKWVEVQSKMEEANAQLDLAKKAYADCKVYAPVSGIIGNNVMQAGETALPALTVATILNINTVKIKVSIPEKEIASINPNTPSIISVDALGKTFSGGRIEKSVQADAVTHTYDIKINAQNQAQQLLPGMVCSVEIKANDLNKQSKDVITVPITAVQQSADGHKFIWKAIDIQDNRQSTTKKAHTPTTKTPTAIAKRQPVTLGEASGNRIAVLSGIQAGDVVITQGFHKLSEGTEVRK